MSFVLVGLGVLVLGALVFGGAVGGAARSLRALQTSEFLCDACKYNHPDTCTQAERPNATQCSEFRSRNE